MCQLADVSISSLETHSRSVNGRYRGYSSERRYRKNHLALSMAVAAQQAGRAAAIIDLDPQASASNWGDRRKGDLPAVVSAQPGRLSQILRQPKRAVQIWSSSILHHEQNGRPWPPPARLIWYLFPAAPQSSILRLSQQHLTLSLPLAQSHSPPYSMRFPRAARNANKQSRY